MQMIKKRSNSSNFLTVIVMLIIFFSALIFIKKGMSIEKDNLRVKRLKAKTAIQRANMIYKVKDKHHNILSVLKD